MPPMNKLTLKGKRALLALASLALALGIGEAGLRLLGYVPRTRSVGEYYTREIIPRPPGLPFLYKPNVSFVMQWPGNPHHYFRPGSNSLVFDTNNAGFRGRDFS